MSILTSQDIIDVIYFKDFILPRCKLTMLYDSDYITLFYKDERLGLFKTINEAKEYALGFSKGYDKALVELKQKKKKKSYEK